MPPPRPPFARGPVLGAAAAVTAVLVAASPWYGYHRDELYFRMLPLDWGYVDQPPLAPLVARLTILVADEPWAMHLPPALAMGVAVVVVALVARELGGGRAAQGLAAAAYATALLPLEFSRVLLTATLDLVVWPLVVWCVLRAVLHERPRWWLVAGLVVGLGTYDKLLVGLLVVGLAAAVALVGPRRLLVSPWVWGGAAVALAVAAPNLAYQATHDWPQLAMGRALREQNAGEVRLLVVPTLLVAVGLPLVPVWVAGLLGLLRRAEWRAVRLVAVALPVVVVATFVGGGQIYYPIGLLGVLLAAGCVRTVAWWRTGPPSRRRWVLGAVAANAATSAVVALPLVPAEHLAATPVPLLNQVAQDQVGWPGYVADLARVRAGLAPDDRARSVVVADDYGLAGAVDRYGPAYGIDEVYSPHNALWELARPPHRAHVAVVAGRSLEALAPLFGSCRDAGTLLNEVGLDNQVHGAPVAVCRDPLGGWPTVWDELRRLG